MTLTAHPFVIAPPRQLRRGISATLSSAIMRAVELDPELRFPSAATMRAAIEKSTRPRGFSLPGGSAHAGAATDEMSGADVSPAAGESPRRGVRLGRWAARVVGVTALVLITAALVLLPGGVYALASVAERSITSADWKLGRNASRDYVNTELELTDALRETLGVLPLNVANGARVDLRYPDLVLVDLELSPGPVTIEAYLDVRRGIPVVNIERLNGVPLYAAGPIISRGICRGFERAWEGAQLRVRRLSIEGDRLVVELW